MSGQVLTRRDFMSAMVAVAAYTSIPAIDDLSGVKVAPASDEKFIIAMSGKLPPGSANAIESRVKRLLGVDVAVIDGLGEFVIFEVTNAPR